MHRQATPRQPAARNPLSRSPIVGDLDAAVAAAAEVLGTLSDGELLATLPSLPADGSRESIMDALMKAGRFALVQRAVERGVVDPETGLGTGG